MAHHHIKKMVNREEIESVMKSSAYSLALKLCQPSGNVPPSIGAKRDECAPACSLSAEMAPLCGRDQCACRSHSWRSRGRWLPLSTSTAYVKPDCSNSRT
jgi:hypothetical protein